MSRESDNVVVTEADRLDEFVMEVVNVGVMLRQLPVTSFEEDKELVTVRDIVLEGLLVTVRDGE